MEVEDPEDDVQATLNELLGSDHDDDSDFVPVESEDENLTHEIESHEVAGEGSRQRRKMSQRKMSQHFGANIGKSVHTFDTKLKAVEMRKTISTRDTMEFFQNYGTYPKKMGLK